jgi:hypothetical protein
VATDAAESVNVRGIVLEVHLRDIWNRVREVVLHGVRCGTAVALATAQVHFGYNLRLLPHGFPVAYRLEDCEDLVEDFRDTANTVAFISLAEDIMNKVFFGP